jgi:hypothetical protein
MQVANLKQPFTRNWFNEYQKLEFVVYRETERLCVRIGVPGLLVDTVTASTKAGHSAILVTLRPTVLLETCITLGRYLGT